MNPPVESESGSVLANFPKALPNLVSVNRELLLTQDVVLIVGLSPIVYKRVYQLFEPSEGLRHKCRRKWDELPHYAID